MSPARGRSVFNEGPKCLDEGPKCLDEGPKCLDEGPTCLHEGPKCLFQKRAEVSNPGRSGRARGVQNSCVSIGVRGIKLFKPP